MECQKCGRKGHTIERCFKIIGYPPKKPNQSFQNKRISSNNSFTDKQGNSNINNDSNSSVDNTFLTAQISRLMNLLSEKKLLMILEPTW